ncbi:MAG: AEC family transporter [Caldilineaceae bacterium]
MTQLFTIFLNILAPVFTLVLIGYIIGPRLQIEARSISRIAYFLLAPAFLFNVIRQAEIDLGLALRVAGYILVVTLVTALVGFVLARIQRAPTELTAAYVLVAAFGNVGNFGFPIIQFKYGDAALSWASIYFLILSTTGFVIGVSAASWARGRGMGSVLAVFKTPAIVAAIPAFLANGFAIPLPLFVERVVVLLAGALIPIMLLTLGIQLAGIGRIQISRHVVMAGLVKLLIGPTLALLLAAPFALDGLARGTGVLQAAMPTAVLAMLIALEHDLMPNFVTTVVLFSTVISALTLTVVLAIV